MSRGRPDAGNVRHLTVYDGREMIGTIFGAGRDWRTLDERGNPVPGAPFKSQKIAVAALNASRAAPCASDARMDNS